MAARLHPTIMDRFNLKKTKIAGMSSLINFHYGYIVVFCCCLIMGVNIGLVMSCAGIFYKPVSTELGVTIGDFGLYMTFVYLFSTLMLSVAGKLMDKYSARWLLTSSSAVLGLVLLAMSTFNSVWQFYAAGAVIGLSLAFLLYLSYPTLINRWFNSNVGFFIGICSAASGIGGVIFNPFGGYLIANYGWRTTYIIFGLIILIIVTPILAVLLRSFPKDKKLKPLGDKPHETVMTGISYSSAVKSPVFYALILFAFLMISVSTLNLFLPTYVTGSGYSLEESAIVASAIMLGVTLGKVVLGWINDKNTFLGVAVSVGFGILGLVFLYLGKYGISIMTFGGFLFGWAYAGVTVETALMVRTVFGNKDYAKIFSNISISLAAGGAIMSGGWGYLTDSIEFKYILITAIILLSLSGVVAFYAVDSSRKFKIIQN